MRTVTKRGRSLGNAVASAAAAQNLRFTGNVLGSVAPLSARACHWLRRSAVATDVLAIAVGLGAFLHHAPPGLATPGLATRGLATQGLATRGLAEASLACLCVVVMATISKAVSGRRFSTQADLVRLAAGDSGLSACGIIAAGLAAHRLFSDATATAIIASMSEACLVLVLGRISLILLAPMLTRNAMGPIPASGLDRPARPSSEPAPFQASADELPCMPAATSAGGRSGPAVKRAIDMAVSGAAIVLLLPALLLVAALIRLESDGPALFRQRRMGCHNIPFTVLKFRTMRADIVTDGSVQAVRGDARVTRLGAILRKTSIDELPQLLNVLGGSMSLVGPRPHPLALNERFEPLIDRYSSRHDVLPGITGWAQVNGCRGETATVDMMRRRVEYDLEYVDRRSNVFDLWILVRTVNAVFATRHVY